MKEFNLTRLMDSCCVTIDTEVYDALFDYLIDIDIDLNELNIDDLYVNGVQFLNEDDYKEDEYSLLLKTDDGYWVL